MLQLGEPACTEGIQSGRSRNDRNDPALRARPPTVVRDDNGFRAVGSNDDEDEDGVDTIVYVLLFICIGGTVAFACLAALLLKLYLGVTKSWKHLVEVDEGANTSSNTHQPEPNVVVGRPVEAEANAEPPTAGGDANDQSANSVASVAAPAPAPIPAPSAVAP